MKKNNPRIKENITIFDEINAVESIVSSYFMDGQYTPYYCDIKRVVAIAENFLEGLEFEENESIYDAVVNDPEVYGLVLKFFFNDKKNAKKENEANMEYIYIMNRVFLHVEDIVEFKKQQMIHNDELVQYVSNELFETLGVVKDFCFVMSDSFRNFANLNLTALTPEVVEMGKKFLRTTNGEGVNVDEAAEIIKKAVSSKLPESETVDLQQKRIAEQQEQSTEKEEMIQRLIKENRTLKAKNILVDK